MARTKNFPEEVSDKMRIPDRVKCDNVLKWDGNSLYLIEQVYRSDAMAGERRKDVTDEIASHIARLLARGKLAKGRK
jgi:hypothetical protein